MNEQHKKRISKFLSLVLRHKPEVINLTMDENGWADTDDLMKKCSAHERNFTFEELEEIVETNDKKRFVFNEDKTRIRANQGHSIEIDLALEPQKPPEFLYHGTAEANVASILQQGIEKRDRQHVHLSEDRDTAAKVGMRHGKPVILVIQTGKMHEEGIPFYLSDNHVWLTDFVDPQYIRS